MREIIGELNWLKIKIDAKNIEIQLVDKNGLSEVSKAKEINPHHMGLTIYNYILNNFGNTKEINCIIYILEGMPKLQFLEILAHELMHVWQYRNSPKENDLTFSEGSCNYAAYLILKTYRQKPDNFLNKENLKMIDFLIYRLENNSDPVYGEGFRKVKKFAEKKGIMYWLDYLKKNKELPKY